MAQGFHPLPKISNRAVLAGGPLGSALTEEKGLMMFTM